MNNNSHNTTIIASFYRRSSTSSKILKDATLPCFFFPILIFQNFKVFIWIFQHQIPYLPNYMTALLLCSALLCSALLNIIRSIHIPCKLAFFFSPSKERSMNVRANFRGRQVPPPFFISLYFSLSLLILTPIHNAI